MQRHCRISFVAILFFLVPCCSGLVTPSWAAGQQKLPRPGTYVERNDSWILAFKLEPRGKVFQVTGLLQSLILKRGYVVKGTYYPAGNKLKATWSWPDPKTNKTKPVAMNGDYEAANESFYVKVGLPAGAGHVNFVCARSSGP